MFIALITIVILLFLAMLFLNLYFRVRVLRAYRVLVNARVQFKATDIFNRSKVEEEIIPAHPEHEAAIWTFRNYLLRSIRMATVLLALITLFGGILMYYR